MDKDNKRKRTFINADEVNKTEIGRAKDIALKPKFRHLYSDMPDEKGIPNEFYSLLVEGKKAVVVEILDYKFEIATLEEWEEREIRKQYSNVNIESYSRLYKVDTLTHCIMKIERGSVEMAFTKEDQIPILRNMLLYMSPIVLDSLFFAYLTLLQKVEEEFNAKHGELDQRILEQIEKAFPR